jgi:sulfate permease, SulP family
MKKYFNLFDFRQKVDYKIEVLSGLTVALALVPEAVANPYFIGNNVRCGYTCSRSRGLQRQ